ncbi:Elongator complex protein 2 [[Candida] zeylanoides]
MFTQEAVFIGANRQANSSDYSERLQVAAFGAATTVALWRPLSSQGVYATLKGHDKEVTGVKFVPDSPFLVSCSEDGHVIVWKESNGTFERHQSLSHHEQGGSVIALATSSGNIATGGVDGDVVLWQYDADTDQWRSVGVFRVKQGFYPTCIAIKQYVGEVFVAVGGTSNNLYLFHKSQGATVTVLSGHEDWVKTLAWTEDSKGCLLASGSQDRYIRLWRVQPKLDTADSNELVVLANKKEFITSSVAGEIEVLFEALIMGHDDWVTGLVWDHASKQLLSSSADTVLMIWEMEQSSGVWVCTSRLGEVSIKGASTATGSSGGFWSCLWIQDNDNECILANGKNGSVRKYVAAEEHGAKSWSSALGLTGPSREVTDLAWSHNRQVFYATSLDQTTRLFGFSVPTQSWREFARPQIHGYDMICIAPLDDTKFVSGGDEKVLRVFEMTTTTADLLRANGVVVEGQSLPVTASLPVLGLSNKADNEALADEEANGDGVGTEDANVPQPGNMPPLEDQLQRTTLFPETDKLYGHGYELTSCTTTDGFIASACRSNTTRHAAIRVFETGSYQLVHTLEAHNLTVTSMAFSPDGTYLIAVSRDRQLSMWNVAQGFKLIEISQAHSRIIWDCDWLSDSEHFVTGSRDRSIKLWRCREEGFSLVATQTFESPVCSVATATSSKSGTVLAVGMETGIQIYKIDVASGSFKQLGVFETEITPAARVSKLAWGQLQGTLRLAVGSADSSVRVYGVDV